MSQEKKKKKTSVVSIIFSVILAVILILGFPYQFVQYSDGTTRLTSLTYTVMFWHSTADGTDDQKTCVYFYPDNFKTYEELWELEN